MILATKLPIFLAVGLLFASPAHAAEAPALLGIPVEFILFALTLLGVALFHHHTLAVALSGLFAITLYKLLVTGFHAGTGLAGLLGHLQHEWVVLTNLLGLLLGFSLLSRHFEESHIPKILPRWLPDDWKGGFMLLAMVFVLSSFLDNIAAALIGGTVAASVFHRRVHIGYLAAIVAASNAGGSGSVVGDTTTTMMWIDGVSSVDVINAYAAAIPALLFFGVFAARQQQAFAPIQKDAGAGVRVDWARVAIVIWILAAAIGANVIINTRHAEYSSVFPFIGAAVWVALLLAMPLRKPEWSLMPERPSRAAYSCSHWCCALP